MKKNVIYITLFFLLFIAPSFIFLALRGKLETVNDEKRELSAFPELSLSNLRQIPEGLSSYYDDRLPFRAQFVEANAFLNYRLFKTSPVDSVIAGKDGWLFYDITNEESDTLNDYYVTTAFTEEELLNIKNHLGETQDKLESEGKEFYVLVIPNKESIYGDEFFPDSMPRNAGVTRGDLVVKYLRENSSLNVSYSKDDIKSAIEEFPEFDFYYKTDTHTNALGSYINSKSMLHAAGVSLPALSEISIKELPAEPGDLANMMGGVRFVPGGFRYEISGFSESKPEYQENGEGELYDTISVCDGGINKKVLVIGDSFTTSMMPYVASQFESVRFVHKKIATEAILSEYNPDIVFYEIVERNFRILVDRGVF